jgi:preprotein translocase subunit SecF
MEIIKKQTHIDFIGKRRLPMGLSMLLNVLTLVALFVFGLNFGLDFTGGTLVELSYAEAADVTQVRQTLANNNFGDAVVQRFGTARDLMVRLPVKDGADSAKTNAKVVAALRATQNEREVESRPGQAQRCIVGESKAPVDCRIQVRRVEFVGPQVGEELVEKGGMALLLTTIGVLIYVIFRFEWRFAVGAIAATAHDVFLLFGFFSVTQMEFSLTVLAAIMAVLGYSLNDTIVVFDRVRENFRKMRKSTATEIMNAAINQTLARTIITSGTTLLTMFALFFYGGEIIHNFSLAMIVGILVGTYSSIFIATPVTLALGITREDMMPVKKETTQEQESLP